MSSLFSWIDQGEGKPPLFVKDSDVEAFHQKEVQKTDWDLQPIDWKSAAKYCFIERCFKTEHYDCIQWGNGVIDVPISLAQAVNRGKLDKLANNNGWDGVRYNDAGHIEVSWWPSSFLEEIKQDKVQYLDNHGEIDSSWEVFDSRAQALEAAGEFPYRTQHILLDSAKEIAISSSRQKACEELLDYTCSIVWDTVRFTEYREETRVVNDIDWAISLCSMCSFILAEEEMKYAKKKWAIWEAGYGCLCDVDGVFYVYKKP